MAALSHTFQEINNILDNASKECFGIPRSAAIKTDTCLACKKEATEFRDEKSRKEFSITGLCQKCQDSVFEEPTES